MGLLNKSLLILVSIGSFGCGVKGRPLPPLNPAPMGRGEPTYHETAPLKKTNKTSSGVPDSENTSGRGTEE